MNFPDPEGMSEDGYPIPTWNNNDIQFTDGAELAGAAISSEVPDIPLVWNTDTYAFNANLKNFEAARNSMYHCAYAYWDVDDSNIYHEDGPYITSLLFSTIFYLIIGFIFIICMAFILYPVIFIIFKSLFMSFKDSFQ